MTDGQDIPVCSPSAFSAAEEYIELHASSAFSFLASSSEPESYIERAVEMSKLIDEANATRAKDDEEGA